MLPAPEDPNDIDPLFPAQVGELLEEDVEEAIMKAAPAVASYIYIGGIR